MWLLQDFEPRWYTVVGVSIVLTILINSIGPQISPLFKWLVVAPMQRWCYAKRCVTQVGTPGEREGLMVQGLARLGQKLTMCGTYRG